MPASATAESKLVTVESCQISAETRTLRGGTSGCQATITEWSASGERSTAVDTTVTGSWMMTLPRQSDIPSTFIGKYLLTVSARFVSLRESSKRNRKRVLSVSKSSS